ncbi:MAG: hypothetical protein HY817_04075 [Candidatus Abawacabacteria bacterium]|nr:hypothetical protein [Candidatus Abawacabacteria bacterium]
MDRWIATDQMYRELEQVPKDAIATIETTPGKVVLLAKSGYVHPNGRMFLAAGDDAGVIDKVVLPSEDNCVRELEEGERFGLNFDFSMLYAVMRGREMVWAGTVLTHMPQADVRLATADALRVLLVKRHVWTEDLARAVIHEREAIARVFADWKFDNFEPAIPHIQQS